MSPSSQDFDLYPANRERNVRVNMVVALNLIATLEYYRAMPFFGAVLVFAVFSGGPV
jgi:hypothetical protein